MANALSRGEREVLLAAATAAPSLFNTQPWRFSIDGTRVGVYADPSRQLRQADPAGRQLVISCGAAVLNLRLAAEHIGRRPHVHLMPDPGDHTLVATVDLRGPQPAPSWSAMLYDAIPYRHTNRYPFEDEPIPATAFRSLVEAARMEDCALVVPADATALHELAELVRIADLEHDQRPELLLEAAEWAGVEFSRADGVPGYALGPVPDDPRASVRDLRRGSPVEARPEATFEHRPTLAVLATAMDDRLAWIRAGQALQRVLLTCTLQGLAASFVNQPLETAALRGSVLGPAGRLRGHPQMIMRIGRGLPVAATPRRPVSDVVGQVHRDTQV